MRVACSEISLKCAALDTTQTPGAALNERLSSASELKWSFNRRICPGLNDQAETIQEMPEVGSKCTTEKT